MKEDKKISVLYCKLLVLLFIIIFSVDLILTSTGPNSFFIDKHGLFFILSLGSLIALFLWIIFQIYLFIKNAQWKNLIAFISIILIVTILVFQITNKLRIKSEQKAIQMVESIIYHTNFQHDLKIDSKVKKDFESLRNDSDIKISNYAMIHMHHLYCFEIQSKNVKPFRVDITFYTPEDILVSIYRPGDIAWD